MKLNWGYKLMLVIFVFIGMMGYLVYQCLNTKYELVANDYYKQELQYQKIIDGRNNADALTSQPSIQLADGKISIQLPNEMKNIPVNGHVYFYCPTAESSDRFLPFQPNAEGTQILDAKTLQPGNYTVKLDWTANNRYYYTEKQLNILK